MAIKETELVTLNGDTTVFGGRIYNANYQVGFNESPSTVRLSIINESGIYNIGENDLSILGSPDTISFGGRSLSMFPIEYSIDKSEGGKILTVEYVDSSVIYLDKKYVLLHKRHSDDKTNSPSDALMVLGNKYYSVEAADENGNYVQSFSLTPPNDFDLGKSLYTLSELYSVMQQHNIPMDESVENILLNKDGASDYLNDIRGTLRSVLLGWAQLMAFAFYWGEDNKLHAIDLASNINVDLDKLGGIIPFTEEESYSLKDTVDRGFSVYYGKEGKAQTGSVIGTNKTSVYFKRGVDENYNNEEIADGEALSSSAVGKLNMLKIAALGEDFYAAYTLWLSSNFGGVYTQEDPETGATFFGFGNPVEVSSLMSSTNYEIALDYVDPQSLYRDSKWKLVRYTQNKKSRYPFAFFEKILKDFLTYEAKMSEGVFEKNQWSPPIEYDYEDNTNFLRNDIELITEGNETAQSSHRAFFIGSINNFLTGITDKKIAQLAEETFVPIDFANIEESIAKFFRPDEYSYAFLDKNADFNSIMGQLEFKNKLKYKVNGFRPSGGAYNSITPKLEKIYLESPDFNSNTISTDMQIETGDDLTISLAGQNFGSLADLLNESYLRDIKSFRKTFSITGISLPQIISPEDGLQSISISNTNDKGTVSTYTVGNSFFKLPSRDIILQRLEGEKYAELKSSSIFDYSIRYF